MTTLAQIRAAIVAELSAITGIGRVHDYERYAKQESEFRNLYLADLGGGVSQIRGWHVRRLTTSETHAVMASHEDVHEWQLRGFMAIDDSAASEKTFDDLIEAVRARFRANNNLGGLIASVYSPDGKGPELTESQPVLLAGVLCHSARIKLITTNLY